jgi:hypothetical protein
METYNINIYIYEYIHIYIYNIYIYIHIHMYIHTCPYYYFSKSRTAHHRPYAEELSGQFTARFLAIYTNQARHLAS